MKSMLSLTLSIALMLVLASSVSAQIPRTVSYQGMLTDADNRPANGSSEMAFRLYESETGGTALWEERRTVSVKDGLFDALLGSITPLALPFDAPYWLEVVVDGTVLPTRTPLASAPYSLNAAAIEEGVAVTSLNDLTDDVDLVEGNGIQLDVDEGSNTITINAVGQSDFSLPYDDSAAALGKAVFRVRNTASSGKGISAETKGGAAVEAIGWQGISVRGGKPTVTNGGGEGIGVDVTGSEGSAFRVGHSDGAGLFVSKAKGTGAWVFDASTGFEVTKANIGVKVDSVGTGVMISQVAKEGVRIDRAANGVVVGKAGMNGVLVADAPFGMNVMKAEIGVKLDAMDKGITIGSAVKEGMHINRAATGVFVDRADTFAFRVGQAEFGLFVGNARFEGVNVQNAASNGFGVERCAHAGLKVVSAYRGVDVWTVSGDGFAVDTAGLDGLYVNRALENGVHINSSVGAAVYVDTTEADGLFVKHAEESGVRVVSAAEDGVHVAKASRHGLIVDTAGYDGLHIAKAGSYGIFASGRLGAGYFNGSVTVTGSLSKGSGTFKIDHPQDPLNKYLYHSFVESPEMMNVYNGNATLDENGETWVELPSYFESLNREFRYQLTALGAPGPNLYVAEEIHENRFRIAGGTPGMKVSWQVTGVRKDPYAEMNRVQVEVEKPENERGTYLHPEAYAKVQ